MDNINLKHSRILNRLGFIMIFIGIAYYLVNCSFPPINKGSYDENKLLIKPNGGTGATFELIDSGNSSNIKPPLGVELVGEKNPFNKYPTSGEGVVLNYIVYGEVIGKEEINGESSILFRVDKWTTKEFQHPPIDFFFTIKFLLVLSSIIIGIIFVFLDKIIDYSYKNINELIKK